MTLSRAKMAEIEQRKADKATCQQRDMEALTAVICEKYDITPERLRGRRRLKILVEARRDFAHKAREMGYSFPVIGRHIGRDHSSVINLLHPRCLNTISAISTHDIHSQGIASRLEKIHNLSVALTKTEWSGVP